MTTDIHSVGPRTDDREQPRCLVCGHVITCDESIAAGIGRDCRRRLRSGLRDASPTVRRIFRELLEAAGSGAA